MVQSQIGVLKGPDRRGAEQHRRRRNRRDRRQGAADHRKKQEITADQWTRGPSSAMAAMQELREGGSVAMLSSVTNLYELLTFNEVLQDISVKDTEILDNMKQRQGGAGNDKAQLEEQTQRQRGAAEQEERAGQPERPDDLPSRRAS